MYDIPTYYPHTAQKKYLLRRSYCHRGMFSSQEVIDYIRGKAAGKLAELITSLKNTPHAAAGSTTVDQWFVQWRDTYKVPSGLILHAKTLLMPVLALADTGSFSAQKRIQLRQKPHKIPIPVSSISSSQLDVSVV